MNEEEHNKILKELETKWVGKKTPEGGKILSVLVDYRKTHQFMNRVEDEFGNHWYITELEKSEEKCCH